MSEKLVLSPSQLERLSDDDYAEFLSITVALLSQTESRYNLPDIESMSEDEIIDWIGEQQSSIEREVLVANQQLIDGGTLSDWERTMSELVSSAAILAALFAFGGLDGLRQQSVARTIIDQTRATIRGQLRAIRQTANSISSGNLSPAQIDASAYRRASAVRESYEKGKLFDAIANKGHNEGFRSLGSTHPCPDCPQYETGGWVPIENIVPIAAYCVCRLRCKCRLQTRFNPDRFIEDINAGRVGDRIRRYQESLTNHRIEFLSRHGWL